MRSWKQELDTGQPLDLEDRCHLHPVVQHLLQRQDELQEWVDSRTPEVAMRPTPCQVSDWEILGDLDELLCDNRHGS